MPQNGPSGNYNGDTTKFWSAHSISPARRAVADNTAVASQPGDDMPHHLDNNPAESKTDAHVSAIGAKFGLKLSGTGYDDTATMRNKKNK